MKNISIPHPCSEDFSLMTPTERGAFCQKCAKDTYDFRHKSTFEIKQILRQHTNEEVCGRITDEQLELLNLEFEQWSFHSVKSFQSIFIFSLFIVFGFSLFSCTNPFSQLELNRIRQGPIRFQSDTVALYESNVATVHTKRYYDSLDSINHWIAGPIDYTPKYVELLEETADSTASAIASTPVISLDGTLYPNPTINSSNLELQIPDSDYYTIDLFNMNGQHIRNLHDGKLEEGPYKTEVSLFGHPPGMYLLVVKSGSLSKTFRIEKI